MLAKLIMRNFKLFLTSAPIWVHKANVVFETRGKYMPKEPRDYTIDGLPVRNLKHKIRLIISDEDCKKGNKKAPAACAAALAATRQVPNCSEARIHVGRVFLKLKNKKQAYWLRGKTTAALRTEIATFDRGGTFEPGIYDINPLTKSEMPFGKRKGHHPPRFGHGRPGKHR